MPTVMHSFIWAGRAAVLAVLLSACSAQVVTTSTSPAESGQPAAAAALGDTITLHGQDEDLVVDVTPMKVRDPAPAPKFLGPGPGNRYVAIQLRLRNTGQATYSDSPSNGAVVVDQDDQQYEADITDAVEPGLGTPKIAPGDERVGYLSFVLPKRAKVRAFQFTLDSGFGPDTGEWTL